MATQALSNLAALQQLFAPVGQQIGNLNSAQLAIAQDQAARARALENLQLQQAFQRERDAFGRDTSVKLAELNEERQDKRLKSETDRLASRELQQLRANIRAVYSEYKQKGGKKKLEELGQIDANDLKALTDLAGALSDEMGEIQQLSDVAVVKELQKAVAMADARVQAERGITAAEMEDITLQAASAITNEKQRKNFFDALSAKNPMKPDEIIRQLSTDAQQEIQMAKRAALRAVMEAKLKGEPLKAALQSRRDIEDNVGKMFAKNPRLREVFGEAPLGNLQQTRMAPDPGDFAPNLPAPPPPQPTAPAGPVDRGYGGVLGLYDSVPVKPVLGNLATGAYDAASYATGAPLLNYIAGGQKRLDEGNAEREAQKAAILQFIGAPPMRQQGMTLPNLYRTDASLDRILSAPQPYLQNLAQPTYPVRPGP